MNDDCFCGERLIFVLRTEYIFLLRIFSIIPLVKNTLEHCDNDGCFHRIEDNMEINTIIPTKYHLAIHQVCVGLNR